MKLRCAILDDYQNVALNLANWSTLSAEVEVMTFSQHFDKEDELVDRISDFDIVVIMRERTPFRSSLLDRLPRLKLLITTGMRNASIDLAAAAAHGVVVCGTAGSSHSTVELTWALILGLARNVVQETNSLRANGPWQSSIGTDPYGKRLGLIGLGKIGSQVARIGLAFGMEVIAWSENLTKERTDELGVGLAFSKEELLNSSDFVTIHTVLSERTRGLIGLSELQQMRPTAFLINTSRAAIVNQTALIEVLQKQLIAGAGLDVFDIEPLPKDDILRALPNALATPHLGYVSHANYQTFYREALEDIQAYLSGSPIRRLS
jgi:phosphoglycerate dehydrogenase-like enzyme